MPAKHDRKTVNLALQGGGAHGAFTWGALDRLLEENRLNIEGISGTSAGAMNAMMLKTGFVDGGREGAKAQLDRFWGSVRHRSAINVNPLAAWVSLFSNDAAKIADTVFASPLYQAQDAFGRAFSPYDWNPLNINPLRGLLAEMIDFDAVCRHCRPHLFISATNVRTGRIKVFHDKDLKIEVVLASSALPNLFQAVEVDGEHYWDGGFMGNPALYPLFNETETADTVIIHVNPVERADVPTTAAAIQNRVNEISFNSSLLRELRNVEFVTRLMTEGKLKPGEQRMVHIHSIRDDVAMADLNVATKLSPAPELFDYLKEAGHSAADRFLKEHWGAIGSESSLNLAGMFA